MNNEEKINIFLEEVKSQYKQEFEIKSTLENKSNYLLVAAGITITFLLAFSSSLLENLNSINANVSLIFVLLIFAVLANSLSILFSVWGFAIMNYRFAMKHYAFFDNEGTIIEDVIKENIDEDNNNAVDEYKMFRIETYLNCNKRNSDQNHDKAIIIIFSQVFFLIGVIIIPFIIFIGTIPLL